MIIGISSGPNLKEPLDDSLVFMIEVLPRIIQQHPEHSFYFFTDRPNDSPIPSSQNVTIITISSTAPIQVLQRYWNDVKMGKVLKKIKADVFLSLREYGCISTRVPQCILWINRHAHKKDPLFFFNYFLLKHTKQNIRLLTVSAFEKNKLIKQYKIAPHKIDVVNKGVSQIFRPCPIELKDAIKQKYTEGREFFICKNFNEHPGYITDLLKAFSLFKKRQQTNWKLVIAGEGIEFKKKLDSLLKNYKYRQDTVLPVPLSEEEAANLTASAYAALFPFSQPSNVYELLQVMKCGVPCISVSIIDEPGVSNSVLQLNSSDPVHIADKLMLIYKDEALRNSLIEKGKAIAEIHNWQKTADLVWGSISKALLND